MGILNFRIVRQIAAAVSAAVLLAGCISEAPRSNLAAAPKGVTPMLNANALGTPQPYRLQIGDVMDVKVMLSPELNVLPAELKASDDRTYEPLGTVVVFQAHNHP